MTDINGLFTHYVPIYLVEHRVEPIRSWCLHGFEGFQGLNNLSISKVRGHGGAQLWSEQGSSYG